MNDQPTHSSLTKALGITAGLVIFIHISLSLAVILLPQRVVHSNILLSRYRTIMVVGPFFYESRIKSSSHFVVRFYTMGKWSSFTDARQEKAERYHRMPWRYDLLKHGEFEEHMARQLSTSRNKDFNAIRKTKPFRELNEFIISQREGNSIDSVSMIYFIKSYLPQSDSFEMDTTFAYTYNPHEFVGSK